MTRARKLKSRSQQAHTPHKHNQQRLVPVSAQQILPKRSTWQVTDNSLHVASRDKVTLAHEIATDNPGETSWRRHEPPQRKVTLPEELLLVSGQSQSYESIAREQQTFIFPLQHNVHGINKEWTFGVWGNIAQVVATVQSLNHWIARERSPKQAVGGNKFDKVLSYTPKERKRAEHEWQSRVQKYRFRQAPPNGASFEAIGLFGWPKDLCITETLGHALEGLDPIRQECACYMLLDEDGSNIEVLGNHSDVERAVIRVRAMVYQMVARRMLIKPRYFLDEHHDSPTGVVTKAYRHPQSLTSAERMPGTTYQGTAWLDVDTVRHEVGGKLCILLMHSIQRLRYLHAHIRFRIRLGTFLAVQHMQPSDGTYSIDDFRTMLDQSQFIGHTSEEYVLPNYADHQLIESRIGDSATEIEALSTAQGAQQLLMPHGAMDETMSDVKPDYIASFDFVEGMSLTLTWQEQKPYGITNADFTPCGRRWSRKEPHTVPARHIDIHLLNLRTNSAWCFDVRSTQSIDELRVPQHLTAFASRVKLNADLIHDADPGKPFVTFTAQRSLRSLRLETCYRYKFKDSEYSLELTRFQYFDYTWSGQSLSPTISIVEPRWRIAIYNLHWDTMLESNDALKAGHRASWSEEWHTWFPGKDGDFDTGLSQLLNVMHDTEALFRHATEEEEEQGVDPYTGMVVS